MTIGVGVQDGKFGSLGLVEVESGTWEVRATDGLELHRAGPDGEWITGECVTVPAVAGLVGFILPKAVEGRKLPGHVVVRDPAGPILGFDDVDTLRAKYGDVIVGHQWKRNDGRPGWLRCPRCGEEKKP